MTRSDPETGAEDGCAFLAGAETSSDDNGRYIVMGVTLRVQTGGSLGSARSRDIRIYTNGFCGY